MTELSEVFSFPNPVNEKAARVVAGGVAVLSATILLTGWHWLLVLVALLLVFATLESVVGFCTGCWLFGRLMQAGVIPEATCQACNNVTWG